MHSGGAEDTLGTTKMSHLHQWLLTDDTRTFPFYFSDLYNGALVLLYTRCTIYTSLCIVDYHVYNNVAL